MTKKPRVGRGPARTSSAPNLWACCLVLDVRAGRSLSRLRETADAGYTWRCEVTERMPSVLFQGGRTMKHPGPVFNPISADLIAQAKQLAEASLDRSSPPQTISELIERYRTHCHDYYRKGERLTSQVFVVNAAMIRLAAVAGDIPPRSMDVITLEQVRQLMVLQKLDRRTVNKYVAAIVQMFEWAAVREFCQVDLPDRLKLLPNLKIGRTPAKDAPPKRSVPTTQLKATLRYLKRVWQEDRSPMRGQPALMLWTMIAVQLRTGMRPNELCQLRWSLIDAQKDLWIYRVPKEVNKTQHHGIEREVFIGPEAQRWLLTWSMVSPGDRLFPITRNSYRQKLTRWLKRGRIEHWHPHQLRHNFATAIERQDDAKAAQVLLGHAHLKTTKGYIDPNAQRAMDLIRRLG